MNKKLSSNFLNLGNFLRVLFILITLLTTSCNSVTPVIDTFNALTGLGEKKIVYQPNIEYLEVKVAGRQAVLALGYRTFPKPNKPIQANIDSQANRYSNDQRVHEYWYSARRETLEIVDGRIESVMGMTTEWRQNLNVAPGWDEISLSKGLGWRRTRDVMPYYQYSLTDSIYTEPLVQAAKKVSGVPYDAEWFQEKVKSQDNLSKPWEFVQLFARYKERIIYSEQCIARDLCLQIKYLGFVNNS